MNDAYHVNHWDDVQSTPTDYREQPVSCRTGQVTYAAQNKDQEPRHDGSQQIGPTMVRC